MEHDQPIGRLAGEDFQQLPGVVGADEEDSVVMGGIDRDCVRDGVENVIDFGKMQELRIARGVDPQTILVELMKRGKVRHFEQSKPSLQDIFVRIASPTVETHQ